MCIVCFSILFSQIMETVEPWYVSKEIIPIIKVTLHFSVLSVTLNDLPHWLDVIVIIFASPCAILWPSCCSLIDNCMQYYCCTGCPLQWSLFRFFPSISVTSCWTRTFRDIRDIIYSYVSLYAIIFWFLQTVLLVMRCFVGILYLTSRRYV